MHYSKSNSSLSFPACFCHLVDILRTSIKLNEFNYGRQLQNATALEGMICKHYGSYVTDSLNTSCFIYVWYYINDNFDLVAPGLIQDLSAAWWPWGASSTSPVHRASWEWTTRVPDQNICGALHRLAAQRHKWDGEFDPCSCFVASSKLLLRSNWWFWSKYLSTSLDSVTHILRFHWEEKHWMTEITTNQTPLIQSLEGKLVGFHYLGTYSEINTQYALLHWCPGCLSCPASYLKTRILRSLCMTMTYWVAMKKWVRLSSIWKTDFCHASDPAVACRSPTVCKYVLCREKNTANTLKTSIDLFDYNNILPG